MRYPAIILISLTLCACGQANQATAPVEPQEEVCRSVWQTGYNGIGELVIGHPATPCHYHDEGPVEVGPVTEPDSYGIIESPLPTGVL